MSLFPRSWHLRLRQGASARLRGALDLGHDSIPLDIAVRLDIQENDRLAVHLVLPLSDAVAAPVARRLTSRERAIVRLIGMGKETGDIASALNISPATVRTHVRNAMSKVEVHTRAQLVARLLSEDPGGVSYMVDDGGDR